MLFGGVFHTHASKFEALLIFSALKRNFCLSKAWHVQYMYLFSTSLAQHAESYTCVRKGTKR